MKFLCSVIFAAIQITASGQGVLLAPGDSYVFEFNSLDFLRPANSLDSAQAGVKFVNDGLDRGETVLLELFADSLTGTPLSATFTTTSDPPIPIGRIMGIAEVWRSDAPPFWPDLQGVFRVTMTSGTTELSEFHVTQIISGGFYSQTFVVPEPSAIALISIGFGFLISLPKFRLRPPGKIGRTYRHRGSSST